MFRLSLKLITFFCILLISAQMQAMPRVVNIDFFFDTTNEPPLDAEVVAEVALVDTKNTSKLLAATVHIEKLMKTSDAKVRQGEKIAVKYVLTGCESYECSGGVICAVPSGSCHYIFRRNPGDKGTIVAKVGTDIDGRLVLCPYSNEPRKGRINPPLAGECDPNEMETAKQIKLAAENGDVKAQTALGLMYGEGRNTRQDTAEALKWFRLAAESGEVEALYQLGAEYNRGRNGAEAMQYLKLAATQGHARAMLDIGRLYEYGGYGVRKSKAKARKWYRLAVENGNWHAKYPLKRLEKGRNRNMVWTICISAGAGLITAAVFMRRSKLRGAKGISK